MKLRDACSWEEKLWQTYFAYKDLYSQSYGFPNSRVWMWKWSNKEGWALKIRCFWVVVLKKTLESSLESKEIKPVSPKGNQPRIFIGRTDAEAPILWPSGAKSGLDWTMNNNSDLQKKSLGFYPAKQLQDTDRLVPWTTMLLFKIVAKAHRAWSFELEEELWRGGGHCAERTQFLSKSWFFSGVCRDPGQKVSTTKVMLLTFWPLWLTQPHIWQLLFM